MKNKIVYGLLAVMIFFAACKKTANIQKPVIATSTNKVVKNMFQAAGCQPLQWLQKVGGYTTMIPDAKGDVYALQGSVVRKISGSNGAILWAYDFGVVVMKILIDGNGNTYGLTLPNTVGSYDTDTYQDLVKVDNNGKQAWYKSVGYTNNYTPISYPPAHFISDFGIDGTGNCYLKGTYSVNEGALDLLSGVFYFPGQKPVGTTVTGNGVFFSKLTPDGTTQGIRSQASGIYIPAHLTVLKDGSLLFVGNHSQNGLNKIDLLRFDKLGNKAGSVSIETGDPYTGGDDSKIASDGVNIYVHTNDLLAKISGSGQLIYKSITPMQNISRSSMTVDKNGNVYFAGNYSQYKGSPDGLTDFDPGTGEWFLPVPIKSNMFIDEYDANGKFKQAGGFVTDGNTLSPTILATGDNYLYFTGFYTNSISLDPASHYVITMTANSYQTTGYGSFLVKYQLCY